MPVMLDCSPDVNMWYSISVWAVLACRLSVTSARAYHTQVCMNCEHIISMWATYV